jgi:hypothetical protein
MVHYVCGIRETKFRVAIAVGVRARTSSAAFLGVTSVQWGGCCAANPMPLREPGGGFQACHVACLRFVGELGAESKTTAHISVQVSSLRAALGCGIGG